MNGSYIPAASAAGQFRGRIRGVIDWLTQSTGRRWLLRALLAYAGLGFFVWIQRPGDFAGYLVVGDLALAGRHIYHDAGPGLNTWPPFFTVISIPLALLAAPSPYVARGFWLLLNFGCLLLVLRLLARLVYDRELTLHADGAGLSLAAPQVLVPLLITWRYVSGNFDHLQVNIVIFALTLGGLYLQTRGRELAGSLALGIAAAARVMPVLFIPYLAYRGRWRAALYTTLVTAVCSLSPAIIFGWSRFWDYIVAWREAVAVGWGVGKMNQSVYAMWDRFIGHGLLPFATAGLNNIPESGDRRVLAAVVVTAAVLAAPSLRAFSRPTRHPWALPSEWSVLFIVSALFGPVGWKAYLVVALLPVTVLFALWRSPTCDNRARQVAGVVLLLFLLSGGLSARGLVGKTLAGMLEMASVPTLAGLLLAGGAVWLRAHLGRAHPVHTGGKASGEHPHLDDAGGCRTLIPR